MEGRKIVLQQTAIAALGEGIGIGIMLGFFALLGHFDLSVVLGGIIGGVLALINFFVMAMFASLAADRAQAGDVVGGEKLAKGTYPVRLLALGVLLFLFAKSGYFNVIALAVPLLFIQPTLFIAEFFRKKEV
jgi:hypothetical protein